MANQIPLFASSLKFNCPRLPPNMATDYYAARSITSPPILGAR